MSGALRPRRSRTARFAALVARRAAREPLAYITGHKEFWSLDFAVGPGVLVPRPDSETLIEEALRIFPDRAAPLRIADLGTGSGALLIAALQEFPNASGIGFESSPRGFRLGAENAAAPVAGRADIRQADWNVAPENSFDLIFCNPPYIPSGEIESLEPDVAGYEPRAALDGGADGLAAYRDLARLLPRAAASGRAGHPGNRGRTGAGDGTFVPGFRPEIGSISPPIWRGSPGPWCWKRLKPGLGKTGPIH